MLTDSITKYVEPRRFFGRKHVVIKRPMTATAAVKSISQWKTCNRVETVVVHLGINDLRSLGKPTKEVGSALKELLETLHVIYSRASVCFSSILLTGEEACNQDIQTVNRQIEDLSKQRPWMVFVKHPALQNRSHFINSVHINRDSGTKIFVADITRTIRAASSPEKSEAGDQLRTSRLEARNPPPSRLMTRNIPPPRLMTRNMPPPRLMTQLPYWHTTSHTQRANVTNYPPRFPPKPMHTLPPRLGADPVPRTNRPVSQGPTSESWYPEQQRHPGQAPNTTPLVATPHALLTHQREDDSKTRESDSTATIAQRIKYLFRGR